MTAADEKAKTSSSEVAPGLSKEEYEALNKQLAESMTKYEEMNFMPGMQEELDRLRALDKQK